MYALCMHYRSPDIFGEELRWTLYSQAIAIRSHDIVWKYVSVSNIRSHNIGVIVCASIVIFVLSCLVRLSPVAEEACAHPYGITVLLQVFKGEQGELVYCMYYRVWCSNGGAALVFLHCDAMWLTLLGRSGLDRRTDRGNLWNLQCLQHPASRHRSLPASSARPLPTDEATNPCPRPRQDYWLLPMARRRLCSLERDVVVCCLPSSQVSVNVRDFVTILLTSERFSF